MKKAKLLLSLVAALAITAGTVSCTQSQSSPAPAAPSAAASAPAASSEASTPAPAVSSAPAAPSASANAQPVTLRFAWWGSDPRHQATLAAISAYKAKYPNVTVEGEYGGIDGYLQKLLTQLASGNAPDLMQIDVTWLGQLGVIKNGFVDLSTRKDIDISQFEDKVIKGFCTTNGIVIGLPTGINGFGVMGNKKFLQDAGLSFAQSDGSQWTWDSLLIEGGKIHAKDPKSYLMAMNLIAVHQFFLSDFVRSKYGKYWLTDSNDLNVSKTEMTDAYTTILGLFDNGTLAPLSDTELFSGKLEQYPSFINGKIGMVEDWSSSVSKYKKVLGADNFGVGKPVVVKGGGTSIKYQPAQLLAIAGNSKNVDEAAKFTNWFLTDKDAALILKDVRSVPAAASSRKALTDANLIDKDVAQVVENALSDPALPAPVSINDSELQSISTDILSKVIYHKETPDKAADEFITRITTRLDAIKKAAS